MLLDEREYALSGDKFKACIQKSGMIMFGMNSKRSMKTSVRLRGATWKTMTTSVCLVMAEIQSLDRKSPSEGRISPTPGERRSIPSIVIRRSANQVCLRIALNIRSPIVLPHSSVK